jgi:hypothetical protein
MLEIYNEQIQDLLAAPCRGQRGNAKLDIRATGGAHEAHGARHRPAPPGAFQRP